MTAFCDALNGGKDIANRKCVHEPFCVSDRRVGLCSTNNASVRRTIALKEIARQKLFRLIALRNRPPQNFSAHFLEESAATKLFRLISSGNRLPQNCFGSFPQEIGRHKTVSAHFLRKSAATKLFRLISLGNRPLTYSLISSGNRWMGFHSFPQEISRMWIASVSNSR